MVKTYVKRKIIAKRIVDQKRSNANTP